MEYYNHLKALHIIFVVTWFAGLFYIVRLFIYHVEAEDKKEPAKSILQKQYKIMSKRLWYIITWPSAILATIFALALLYYNPYLITQPWMIVKFSFVLLLYIYQFGCQKIYKQLQNDVIKHSSIKLRLFNEIATVVLFAVVFLVELQSAVDWIWGVGGIFSLGIIIMLLTKLYKKKRAKKSWDSEEVERQD